MVKKFKLFGLLNIVDVAIVLLLIAAALILFFVDAGKYSKIPQVAQNTQNIEFDVLLKNEIVTREQNIFNLGDKTFITIRNVPHAKLEIVKVSKTTSKTTIPNPKNRYRAIAVEDPSAPYVYDFLVTLSGKAVITNDGVVVGGNKIKIGLPIMLEDTDYRLTGIVSDVRTQEN